MNAGPIGRPKGITEREIAGHLQGEAARFVVLEEDGSLFGWYAVAAILGALALMSGAIVGLVVRSIRRRRRAPSPEGRSRLAG
ncbi:MAG: hypothetical protein M5U28_37700 [Sandaracinaceae bacterium]|nr:hypothetical protein [Sandaracinaceae bacterium]